MKSTWFVREPLDARNDDGSPFSLEPATYFCEVDIEGDLVTVYIDHRTVSASREDFMRVAERRPLNQ
jgi:hypothetical protein